VKNYYILSYRIQKILELTYSNFYENTYETVHSSGNQYKFLLGTSGIKTSAYWAYIRTEFLHGLSRFSRSLQEATPQVKPMITSSKCTTHHSFQTKKPELLNASLQYKCKYHPHVALSSQFGDPGL